MAACSLMAGICAFRSPDPRGDLSVAFSGELDGYLTPCGCSNPMIGGLPRRGTYLKALGPQESLVRVENGDLTNALGRQDELKAETVAEILNGLRYDAISLGEQDFRLGVPYLESLQARFKGAILCANVRTSGGGPVFKESTVADRRVNGRQIRVALVGVISDQFEAQIRALNPDITVESAGAALDRAQSDLAARSDIRVLLYHGPRDEAIELARSRNFQLVIYAHGADDPSKAEAVGKATLVGGGKYGKHMSIASISPIPSWRVVKVETKALGPDLKDDPEVIAAMRTYLGRIATEGLLSQVPKGLTADGLAFAGSDACRPCHVEAHRAWTASGHATALKSLASDMHDKDPECVRCHVVGLEWVGGYVSPEKTPHLASVGCESCHGPASKHVADPTSKLEPVGSTGCAKCHNSDHSPGFEFNAYWKKIAH